MNILVAIDSSPGSEIAVQEVLARPWPAGTNINVLSVVDTAALHEVPRLIDDATETANALVINAAERFSSRDLNVSTTVVRGRPRREIVECAKEWDADLIVVGSHGHGAVTRFFMGSVAQAILRHAPCPVEVVRPRLSNGATSIKRMRLLVATDGSPCSNAAIRSIALRPWPANTEARIVSVAEIAGSSVEPSFIENVDFIERLQTDATAHARDAIAAAKDALAGTSLKISTETANGNPKTAIVDAAKEFAADLIVLGTHGRHGVDRLLMGSVSEAVALYSHCSVEVIQEQA